MSKVPVKTGCLHLQAGGDGAQGEPISPGGFQNGDRRLNDSTSIDLPCDVVSATTVIAARNTTPCLTGFLASRNAIPQSSLVVLASRRGITKSTTLLLARCYMTQSKMKGGTRRL
jgi:hypothetical protein